MCCISVVVTIWYNQLREEKFISAQEFGGFGSCLLVCGLNSLSGMGHVDEEASH